MLMEQYCSIFLLQFLHWTSSNCLKRYTHIEFQMFVKYIQSYLYYIYIINSSPVIMPRNNPKIFFKILAGAEYTGRGGGENRSVFTPGSWDSSLYSSPGIFFFWGGGHRRVIFEIFISMPSPLPGQSFIKSTVGEFNYLMILNHVKNVLTSGIFH